MTTMTHETMTAKIGKLLIQAERTTNEAEQNLFFEKAQKLASTYSVALEVARKTATNAEKRESPIQKRITIGEPGKPLNAVFCELFMDIGRAQDLVFNIAHNSTYVIAFGLPSDIRIAEALYAHIAPQMVRMADAYIKTGDWKGERTWDDRRWEYKPVTSRVARRCFYQAFSSRIGSRMRAAKREVEQAVADQQVITEEGVTSTALVLANKEVEVRDFYKQTSTARGSWKGNRGNTAYSSAGSSAGTQAGSKARLGGEQSLPGGRKAIG